jgi:hypothetical protein
VPEFREEFETAAKRRMELYEHRKFLEEQSRMPAEKPPENLYSNLDILRENTWRTGINENSVVYMGLEESFDKESVTEALGFIEQMARVYGGITVLMPKYARDATGLSEALNKLYSEKGQELNIIFTAYKEGEKDEIINRDIKYATSKDKTPVVIVGSTGSVFPLVPEDLVKRTYDRRHKKSPLK